MRKFMILAAMAAALVPTVSKTAASAPGVTDWYEVSTEHKPYVRWWLLGSAVDSVGLTYNLEQFADKGIGGMEITPIYGVKNNEANDIEYLSPKWMNMYGHTVDESARLGLQVDMNNGTGWPFGGPNVTIEHSARKLVVEQWTLAPKQKLSDRIMPSDKRQQPVATLQKVIAVNGDRRIDITDRVNSDGILDWKSPKTKEDWEVYAIFSGRTLQKVKRAAPGGEGLVVNHLDSVAVKHYLQRFDEAFAASGKPFPDSFFNDSYEVYGANWDDRLLDEFFADHGYRLEYFIPEFTAEKEALEALTPEVRDVRARVIRDYRATLDRMLTDNFTRVWCDWSHSHGARVRNQSHGSPANIIDLYAIVDIPECESFGQSDLAIPGLSKFGPTRPSDADPAVLKFASSAAHVAGKPLTSAESLTWLTEHFCTSLANCKPELDQMFCSGVNHVFFHGAPYSPKDAAFPGHMFYASVNMSPTNSIWRDADGLFRYITRVQTFLTAGRPDNDYLLYFPIEDVWYTQDDRPYLMFEIHKMNQRMPQVKQAVSDILGAGYDCDYLSDSLLMTLDNINSEIAAAGGVKYKGIVVPDVKIISPESLAKLLELARGGATVIFAGGLPSDVPGLAAVGENQGYPVKTDIETGRKQIAELLKDVPTAGGFSSYGRGRVIVAPDILAGLERAGNYPEKARRIEGLSMIRRANEVGGSNYFISMLADNRIDGYVPLRTSDKTIMIFDPLTGAKGLAQTSREASAEGWVADSDDDSNVYTNVRLQLEPGQSVLIKTIPEEVEAEPWRYVEELGAPVDIARGWSISFPLSEPSIEGTFATDSLTAWTNLDIPQAKINFGTARYTAEFTIDDPAEFDDWMLDLGSVRESAHVFINGKDAGKAWSVPFTLRVGEYLHPGVNKIEVDVTNLQINRIIDFEKRGVEWRVFKDANVASVTNAKQFSFADWDIAPAGLTSAVKLIPLTLSK